MGRGFASHCRFQNLCCLIYVVAAQKKKKILFRESVLLRLVRARLHNDPIAARYILVMLA